MDLLDFKHPTMTILVLALVLSFVVGSVYNKPHYYVHNNTTYVSYHNDWYEYDSWDSGSTDWGSDW